MNFTPTEELTPEWGWDFAFITSNGGDPEWRAKYAEAQRRWLVDWWPNGDQRPH